MGQTASHTGALRETDIYRPTGPLIFTHPSVQIGPEIVNALRLSRYSRSLGKYGSARSHLSSYMHMTRCPLPISNEVAASHIAQGYVERAREVLDKALYDLCDERDREGVDYSLLCIQRAYVRARQTGLITEALAEADALWNPLKDARGGDGRVEDVLFDLAGWHLSIVIFAHYYSEMKGPVDIESAHAELLGRVVNHHSVDEKVARLRLVFCHMPLKHRPKSPKAGQHAHAAIDHRLTDINLIINEHLMGRIAGLGGVITLFDQMEEICRLYEDADCPAGLMLALEQVALASHFCHEEARRVSALRRLRGLWEQTGDTFLLHKVVGLGLVNTIANKGHVGQSIELMESLLHDGDHNRPPNPRFVCIYLPKLLECYGLLRKGERGMEYLKMAKDDLQSPDLRETASHVDLALATFVLPRMTDNEEAIIDILLKGIHKDTQEAFHWNYIRKMILLATITAKRPNADFDLAEDYLSNAEAVLASTPWPVSSTKEGLGAENRLLMKFEISYNRMEISSKKADVKAAIAVSDDMALFFNSYCNANGLRMTFGTMVYMCRALCACANLIISDVLTKRSEHFESALQEASRKVEEAMAIARRAGQDLSYLGMFCQIQWAQLLEAWFALRKDISDLHEALSHCDEAIAILDGLRHAVQSSSLSMADVLQMKQRLSSYWICRGALNYCIVGRRHLLDSKDADWFSKEGWNWIQKGKARGLVDVLSMGMTIPASTMEEIQQHSELLELLTRERSLIHAISNTSPGDEPFARSELQRHQHEMVKHPILADMVAARDGGSLTLENLQDMTYDDGEPVAFVDWAVYTDDDVVKRLVLVVVTRGQPPQFEEITLDLNAVVDWKTSYLNKHTLSHVHLSHIKLKELELLVEPLSRMTERGDLLVLSPTGPLHGLPLHALQLEGCYLIERNPVVYSASHSVLRRCVMKHRAATQNAEEWNAAVMSVFEGGSTEETTAVHASVSGVAECFRTTAHLDKEVTVESFSQMSSRASLIHYHGHIKLDGATIQEQALVLSSGQDGSRSESDAAVKLLTVPRVFSLPLRNPHVTIIGCGSGIEDIQDGDEPLGLISAMLCAGATSVVGSLWPIRSADGRKFTERFYNRFTSSFADTPLEAGPVPRVRIVHLARALKDAVVELLDDEETEAPYHWASFVLHGTWRCNLPNTMIHENSTVSELN